jgi:hypothetical protein
MLVALLAVCLAPQRLEVRPSPSLPGETVRVEVRAADRPLAGTSIEITPLARERDDVPTAPGITVATDVNGVATFVAEAPGAYEIAVRMPETSLVRVHRVGHGRRWWWAGFVTVPLGAALAWTVFRRARAAPPIN